MIRLDKTRSYQNHDRKRQSSMLPALSSNFNPTHTPFGNTQSWQTDYGETSNSGRVSLRQASQDNARDMKGNVFASQDFKRQYKRNSMGSNFENAKEAGMSRIRELNNHSKPKSMGFQVSKKKKGGWRSSQD